MRKLAWLAVGCAMASALAVACGGSTEAGAGGSGGSVSTGGTGGGGGGSTIVSEGPVAEDQLAQKYSDAVCSNSGPCCQKYGFAHDASKCSAGLRSELEDDIAQIGKLDGVTYDPAKAGECLAWFKKLVSQCTVSQAEMDSLQHACSAVWKGSKAIGEACTSDTQCAGADTGAADCDQNPSGTDGPKCVASSDPTEAPRGKKGDSCSGTCKSSPRYAECSGSASTGGSGPTPGPAHCWTDDGLQCDSETFTCVDLVPQGQPCSYSEYCVDSAWCSNGVCAPRTPVGGACANQFMSHGCVDGAYCEASSSTCRALAPEGAACVEHDQCVTSRCVNLKCIPANVIAEDEICIGSDDPQPQ